MAVPKDYNAKIDDNSKLSPSDKKNLKEFISLIKKDGLNPSVFMKFKSLEIAKAKPSHFLNEIVLRNSEKKEAE